MEPRARYDEIADDLVARNADVSVAKMLGMPCIKRGCKMVGGFWKESMVFKLVDPEARKQALSLEGAALFDPSEQGRPMREWVAVPAAHADRWAELAEQALTPSG